MLWNLLGSVLLFVIALIAQRLDIDAEQALRRAYQKFRTRFGAMEAMARDLGMGLSEMTDDEREALWERAKVEERANSL